MLEGCRRLMISEVSDPFVTLCPELRTGQVLSCDLKLLNWICMHWKLAQTNSSCRFCEVKLSRGDFTWVYRTLFTICEVFWFHFGWRELIPDTHSLTPRAYLTSLISGILLYFGKVLDFGLSYSMWLIVTLCDFLHDFTVCNSVNLTWDSV